MIMYHIITLVTVNATTIGLVTGKVTNVFPWLPVYFTLKFNTEVLVISHAYDF
jgi:hypothetical protein